MMPAAAPKTTNTQHIADAAMIVAVFLFIYFLRQKKTTGDKKMSYIVVDALNFLGTIFCPVGLQKKFGPWKRIDIMKGNVVRTLSAFRSANYEPIFVIDAGFSSSEVLDTWISRREKEVKRAVRNVPYNADTLLAALLIRHGAKVVRSGTVDADDVCVLLAKQLGCGIVSGDTDMLRYKDWDPQNRLFSFWKFKNHCRGIELIPQRRTEPTATKRDAERVAGEDRLDLKEEFARASSSKLLCKKNESPVFVYRRGNVDENTRAIGNLHATSRPVRIALYAHLDIPTVREVYPSWDGDTVVWVDDVVDSSEADPELIPMLTDPKRLLAWFRTTDLGARTLEQNKRLSREFAWVQMTAEIVAAAAGNPCILHEMSVATLLREHRLSR